MNNRTKMCTDKYFTAYLSEMVFLCNTANQCRLSKTKPYLEQSVKPMQPLL